MKGSASMKKSIIVLLIVAILILCAVAGWLLHKDYITIRGLTAELEEAQASLAQKQAELDDTNSRLAETFAALEAAQTSLAESQMELEDINSRLEETLVALEQAQIRIAELERQIAAPGEPVDQPAPEVSEPEVSQPEQSQPAPSQPAPSQPSAGSSTGAELNPATPPSGPKPSLGGGGGDSGQLGTGTPATGDYSGIGDGF
jgi:competence protein ComGC